MIDRRIKFRHIQCFVEIARERSFKRAAERLYLTGPAISKTLKELEEILGAPLLTRSRAGVALTAQGDVFLHFAEMSLAALQQGLDGVEHAGAQAAEHLVVGALPSVMARLMPAAVSVFDEMRPQARLRILDGPHGYMTDRMKLGEMDLVIGRLAGPEQMQGISFTQLYTERVVFVVRAGHPLLEAPDLKRIVDWPVVYPSPGSAIRPLVDRFMVEQGVGDITRQLETVSGAFGRVYTRRTDVVWIISAGVVANEIADGHLVQLPFETAITTGSVGLMTRAGETPSPVEQVFRMAVAQAVEDLGLTA
ncbi:MAG: pca operon transcription factor PcaQ [Rhodobacteraceae bacterium]|nr:pca operon transcription factor PcaQ [Paracoccaceae bacterium]MAY46838.1 pca operon transcription factor PcaQ [Paracoccaceae bacterium]QEW22032.1 Hca operon transcriptional activator [Marinibacterium anthonyi]